MKIRRRSTPTEGEYAAVQPEGETVIVSELETEPGLRERIKNINIRKRFEDAFQAVKNRRMKTWVVSDLETPNEYEYVEAVSEQDAIARSSYVDKANLVADVRAEYNVFILDPKNGSYKSYVEPTDIRAKIPRAKVYDFEGEYLYYLVREYDKETGVGKLIAYERPDKVDISPEVLFEARNWRGNITEMIKSRDIWTLEKLSAPLLLGLLGILVFLLLIVSDM